jgi:putative ABC transport system permease protein
MSARYAMKEVKRRKLRSSANILGYVIAVAFLIITVSLANGYSLVATGALEKIGTHFVVYIPASTVCPCEFAETGAFFKGVYTATFNSTLVESIGKLQGVENAAPYLMYRLDNLTIGGIDVNALATKTDAVSPADVVKGRYLESNDSNLVMLDNVFADLVRLDVGDQITAFDRNFTIVGIVNPSLRSRPAGLAQMYAPLGVVQNINHYYGDLFNFGVSDANVVLVEISPEGDEAFINTVKQSVLQTLESYASNKGALSGYQCGVEARKIIPVTETSAWVISVVLLASAALFSLKSQFGSVVERTKDIGILKAIGWANSDITKQIFLESFLQGLVGGIIGIGVGYVIIYIVPQLGLVSAQNLVLTLSPLVAVIGLITSIGGGVVAGIFPAWRAAKLQPAEALRRF